MAIPKKTPKPFVSPEEYLAYERDSEERNEYHHGEIVSMVGASFAHNLIVQNLGGEIRSQLKESSCRVVSSTQKVRNKTNDSFFYPDVLIVCDEPLFHDGHHDVLLNPVVIFEVLSPSTATYDRGQKFLKYQQIQSLEHYILLSQDEIFIEHRYKLDGSGWGLDILTKSTEFLNIDKHHIAVSVAEIYSDVFGESEEVGVEST